MQLVRKLVQIWYSQRHYHARIQAMAGAYLYFVLEGKTVPDPETLLPNAQVLTGISVFHQARKIVFKLLEVLIILPLSDAPQQNLEHRFKSEA